MAKVSKDSRITERRGRSDDYTVLEITAARAICQAQGNHSWVHLKDVHGNPSTDSEYYDYLRTGRCVVKEINKLFAKNQCNGTFPRFLKGAVK